MIYRWIARLTAVAAILLVSLPASPASASSTGDWSAYLFSPARTGYNSAESIITPVTAPSLTPVWHTSQGSVSAEPVESGGVVYYGSWDGYERAVSAATGAQLWATYLGQTTDTGCNPPTVGVASTATVHSITLNGVATTAVFVGGGNGFFYALNAVTGAVIWKTSFGSSPSHFLWSSPLFWRGGIYEGIASFGDCPLVRGGIWKLGATTGKVWHRFWTAPSGCTGAAVWGSPARDPASGNIFFGTGNGGSCGSGEPLSLALVEVRPNLSLVSSWQVPSSEQVSDSDFGSTPTMFSASIHGTLTNMVGLANKDGIYYAFDRSAIGSGPLWRRRISVGGPGPQGGKADISPSAWDGTHLYVADGTTTIGGVNCKGTVQSLNPATGVPVWQDCLQGGTVLGAVTEVPGVLFIGDGTYFQAFDASTGSSLFSYQDTSAGSNFWGAASISNGIAYIGNQDGTLYAFGTS